MIILSTVELPSFLKEKLENHFKSITFYHDTQMEKVRELLPKVEILLTYGEDLTDNHIKSATNLKWIMVATAGIDKLPIDELIKRDILVTNSKGIHAIPMAEYCISMMLQVSRRAKELIKNEKERKWERWLPMEEIYGKTLFILGTGAIGTAIAKLSQAFGMKVYGVNRDGREVKYFNKTYSIKDMEDPLQIADFVISVLPSTEQTKEILNYTTFKLMKKAAVFINVGRGDSVVEKDLIQALNENQIKHAVLDVFLKEPLDESHPFWVMENVTVTPHLSGITKNYLPRVIQIFEKNLKCYLNGELTGMSNIITLQNRY